MRHVRLHMRPLVSTKTGREEIGPFQRLETFEEKLILVGELPLDGSAGETRALIDGRTVLDEWW